MQIVSILIRLKIYTLPTVVLLIVRIFIFFFLFSFNIKKRNLYFILNENMKMK